ncbi:hypothetical protein B6N60_03805 [Richelia sinica FACHB-800]|uniref:Uncharacterized protein n=1 Tax=Richelia sinica FACHB-800 TaxID=1357546 RepID=A0A975Y6B5_9NOST|nr:hypothetical protein [Richelia sinica]MBD2664481.1 hypothetical protein [Richelia sinica FACHB-800]QXE25093.1 hypothetical protein B6N60_03803 [Richelia sinica FACHB-800]QXE25095.1 hypothetical protein B6N60_03805 [Richelia sinica FACHB-800]
MSRQLRHKINKYRRQRKNLISTHKIKPEHWQISEAEAKLALIAKGFKVKEIKKIHCLKYQVSISFWDMQGNICCSFFSYRIFALWQREVEKLIDNCQSLKAWARLNYLMSYEFAYYHYLGETEQALHQALENRFLVLNSTTQSAAFSEVELQ